MRLADPQSATWVLAILSAFAVGTGGASAEEGLLERSRLTGSWGGVRSDLSDAGYDFFGRYAAGAFGNTLGGFATGTRYVGHAELGANANLERIAGWQGARFQIRFISYHGGKPSQDLVGQFSGENLSGYEADSSFFRFYSIYVEQKLFDDAVRIKAGQFAADDDFMLTHVGSEFSNATFGDVSSLGKGLSAPVYPLAAPALLVEVHPTSVFSARAGAYSGDTGSDDSSNFGFDWSFSDEKGVALLGELALSGSPSGRASSLTVGIVSSTGRSPSLDGQTKRGSYGFYTTSDVALIVDRDGQSLLSAFVRVGYAPSGSRALQRWRADGGIVKYGVFARRHDRAGVAFAYNRFAGQYKRNQRNLGNRVTRNQGLVELTYTAQLTGWLSLSPDLQVVLDPHFSREDALAVGLTARIEF